MKYRKSLNRKEIVPEKLEEIPYAAKNLKCMKSFILHRRLK